MTNKMAKLQNKIHTSLSNGDHEAAAGYSVMLVKEFRKELIHLMNGGSDITVPMLIACLDEFYAKFKENLPTKVLEDAKDLWNHLKEE